MTPAQRLDDRASLAVGNGILQADAFDGYNRLYLA